MLETSSQSLLELLINISREVAGVLDLRTVLQRLLFATTQYVGAERGSIVVLNSDGKPLDAAIVIGQDLHQNTTLQLTEIVDHGLAGWVVQNLEPVLVPDTSSDSRWLRREDDSITKSGPKSAICVPLIARGELVGVMTLVHPVPNVFHEHHFNLMRAIADQAGVAVLNARLYNDSQRTARVMTALASGAVVINTALEMPEAGRRVLAHTVQALQVKAAGLVLLDNQSGNLVVQNADGEWASLIIGRRICRSSSVIKAVLESGQGLILKDCQQVISLFEGDLPGSLEIKMAAIAPVQAHGNVMGMLLAINPASNLFDQDTIPVMSVLGSLAGTTIQNAQFLLQIQKAHQRYHELFEDSVSPILIADWNGSVLEANRQAVILSGYPADLLRGIGIDQLHQVNWQKTGKNYGSIKAGESCVYESIFNLHNGGTKPVEVFARRVEVNGVDLVQWMFHDITERKELDALRNDLVAMVYHDIRSPLGNIVSSLDMMDYLIPADETLHAILGVAKNSTARIQRLVNSLLDVSRLEDGQSIVDPHTVDPLILVQEALKDVEGFAIGKKQTLQKNLAGVLPFIRVDVDMIHRVLINLLENAIKYTPEGGQVKVGAQATTGGEIKLWVCDNGPGISVADRQIIFEKFTRLRGKQNQGGFGVGLAFCKLAILAHGGRIWVEDNPNQGTCIMFTLPISSASSPGQINRQSGRLVIKEKTDN